MLETVLRVSTFSHFWGKYYDLFIVILRIEVLEEEIMLFSTGSLMSPRWMIGLSYNVIKTISISIRIKLHSF